MELLILIGILLILAAMAGQENIFRFLARLTKGVIQIILLMAALYLLYTFRQPIMETLLPLIQEAGDKLLAQLGR